MKKNIKTLVLASIIFFISNSIIAQETINVTLNVDTNEIKTIDAHNYCSFKGQAETLDARDFTINASLGDVIVWNAVSSSSKTDQVKIVSVNYERGTNVFSDNKINGQNGVVSGTIKNSTVGKDDYKYKISFKIMSNGKLRPGTFHIDPIIKVGSK